MRQKPQECALLSIPHQPLIQLHLEVWQACGSDLKPPESSTDPRVLFMFGVAWDFDLVMGNRVPSLSSLEK
eukprot:m.19104 g.19104  ORF g.19104 m.19104 type:complete len:71 (-) comp7976_c0_seq1:1816-2028(-)